MDNLSDENEKNVLNNSENEKKIEKIVDDKLIKSKLERTESLSNFLIGFTTVLLIIFGLAYPLWQSNVNEKKLMMRLPIYKI